MKKVVLFISFLMIALSFSSCKKEGIDGFYNPKEKIDRIYIENYKGEKYLYEQWNWDNNQLKSIDRHDENGTIVNTETYYYDNDGRITMVHGSEFGGRYSKYYYKDGFLDYVESYYDVFEFVNYNNMFDTTLYDVLSARFDFFYNSDNKLCKVEITDNDFTDYFTCKSANIFNPLRYMLPDNFIEGIERIMKYNAEHHDSRAFKLVVQIEWDGNNISKIKNGSYIETYKYDDKINPYNKLYDHLAAGVYKKFSNENNITYITYCLYNWDYDSAKRTFVYEYKNDLPVKRISEGKPEDYYAIGVNVITSGTYYYEYK